MGKPLPSALTSSIVAGARPMPIVPRSMEEALTLAKAVVASRMAPRGMETPEACLVAILHGLEVGLTPLSALQRIAVIEGRPTIWGDGAMALVRASGLCRSIREWVEGDTVQDWIGCCEVYRKGESEPVTCRFGVEDARRAGLWGKPGPWSSYPRRMLQMRARAFALRDVFADVLGGLYLREEIESEVVLSYPAPSAPAPAALAVLAQPAMRAPDTPAEDRPPEALAQPTPTSPTLETAAELPASIPAHEPTSASMLSSRRAGPPVRRALRKRQQGWVRLRAPREAIRLRAPPPPEFVHREDSELHAATNVLDVLAPDRVGGPLSPAETLTLLDDALACALDPASLAEVEEEFAARLATLPREHLADAERIRARHAERVDALTNAMPGGGA